MGELQFRGSRADLKRKCLELAAVLSGRQADRTGIGRAFLMAIGYAALADIRDAFLVKARGGTDAMGVTWPPLKPETIANRRVGDNKKLDPNARDYVKAREAALRQQRREFERQEGELYERYLLSMDAASARRRARQMAALRATAATGLTKVQALGYRPVEMLRDTGVLFNSLTPGVLSGDGPAMTYTPPGGEGGDQQVFYLDPGEVTIGTNVPYAGTHQHGDPARNIPQRKFLPDDDDQIPQAWWDNWLDAGQQALVAASREFFADGGQR